MATVSEFAFDNAANKLEMIDEELVDVDHSMPVSKSVSAKSKMKYEQKYQKFKAWLQERNVEITENSLMEYIQEKGAVFKSQSSYWGEYSALKSTVLEYDGIDVTKFKKILKFVQMQKNMDPPVFSRTFSREDINRFLLEAPDDDYLLLKVVLIIAVAGGCRCEELTNMSIDDITDKGSVIIVNVTGNYQRTFTIIDYPDNDVESIPFIRKYLALRPPTTTTRRLFYAIRYGTYLKQVIGYKTIAKYPFKIAQYLQLESPREYTGKAFRRTHIVLLEKKTKTTNIL